ncbi:MAG TPA: site-specific integrase [Parvularculaceae bacterium]|nr:site-specific integrase [Parvularculaceae bacterium]HNS87026.1 site-specific integrase [Parvularculaceae bacterium]
MTTAKPNASNERIKLDYLYHLRHARRQSEASIDKAAAALDSFLDYSRHRDLKKFHRRQATAFKDHLLERQNARTGAALSLSTVQSTLKAMRNFTIWLADQPGYKRAVTYTDADYFSLSHGEARAASAPKIKRPPSLADVHKVIAMMPASTDIESRDRAVIAFTILTGARDGATASFRLKHIDIAERRLFQDGRDAATKFRKSFPTFFFPVEGQAEAIVVDWVEHLQNRHSFGSDDPLFPRTKVGLDAEGRLGPLGLDRAPWSNATAIRGIFRKAFAAAGLPYANPHLFRDTLALYGLDRCKNFAEMKAWSQNLGHEDMLTTLRNYGSISTRDQEALIRGLGERPDDEDTLGQIRKLLLGRAA